jgi:hypothetical protein
MNVEVILMVEALKDAIQFQDEYMKCLVTKDIEKIKQQTELYDKHADQIETFAISVYKVKNEVCDMIIPEEFNVLYYEYINSYSKCIILLGQVDPFLAREVLSRRAAKLKSMFQEILRLKAEPEKNRF